MLKYKITKLSLSLLLLLQACQSGTHIPEDSVSVVSTNAPESTEVAESQRSSSTSKTPRPTRTNTPTQTSIPTFTPFPESEYLAFRTADFPQSLKIITPENISQLVQLARWGRGEIRAMAYAQSGLRFAVATSDGVFIYETGDFTLLQHVPMRLGEGDVIISEDLRFLAFGGKDGFLSLWDLNSGQHKFSISGYESGGFAFSPDGNELYTNSGVISTAVGTVLSKHILGADEFAYSRDGKKMAALTGDVGIYDYIDAQNIYTIKTRDDESWGFVNTIAISGNAKWVAMGAYEPLQILIWDVEQESLNRKIDLEDSLGSVLSYYTEPLGGCGGVGEWIIDGMAFSPDGKRLAVALGIGVLTQWDVESGKLLWMDVDAGPNVLYSPSGDVLASGGYTVRFHDADTGSRVATLGDHMGGVVEMEVDPKGDFLAIGSQDSKIWLRRLPDGGVLQTLKGHSRAITDIDMTTDGTWIASGSEDASVRLWNLTTHETRVIDDLPGQVLHVAISDDAQHVVYWVWEWGMGFYNLHTGVRTGPGALDALFTFLPNSPTLLVSTPRELWFYDPEVRDVIEEKAYPGISEVVISNDGKYFATTDEGVIDIWTVEELQVVNQLERDTYPADFVFSPDNQLLAAALPDENEIVIWDIQSTEFIKRISFDGLSPTSVVFSPDGMLLAVGDSSGIVSIWGIPE